MTADLLQLSPFQRRVLAIPEEFDLLLGGGRGGAKSYTLALLALRHAEQHGAKARVLYIRQSHKGCADFESLCLDLFECIYGKALRFNGQEGVFRFPNGATLEVDQLADATDYAKCQRRSFTLLFIDEAGQWPTPELLDRLRSNLRGPAGTPIRCVLAANPGDVGHQWIAKRYVFRSAAPWAPFTEDTSGRMFVYAPSTFLDNPFVDRNAYRKQLESSCPSNPELLRAWLEGDWTVARGAYFGSVLSEVRNAIDPWPFIPLGWEVFLAHDFGSTAPSVTYIAAKSPGGEAFGKWYPRDSLILIDELATAEPGSANKGMGYTVPVLAEMIREQCARWELRPLQIPDGLPAILLLRSHKAGDRTRRRAAQLRPSEVGPRRQWRAAPDATRAARPPRRRGATPARPPPPLLRRARTQLTAALCRHRPRAGSNDLAARTQPGTHCRTGASSCRPLPM